MPRAPAPAAPGSYADPAIMWLLSDTASSEGTSTTTPTSPITATTFTVPPLAAEYGMPKFRHDGDEVVTVATAARVGGTSITVADAAAIERSGVVTWRRTDLDSQSDTDVTAVIERVLLTHKDVLSRIVEVTVQPTFSDAGMWIAACAELNDTVRVKLSAQSLDRYGYIIGIRHNVALDVQTWTTTLTITESGQ